MKFYIIEKFFIHFMIFNIDSYIFFKYLFTDIHTECRTKNSMTLTLNNSQLRWIENETIGILILKAIKI